MTGAELTELQELMARASSLESSVAHYDHATGAAIAAEASQLRDRAQAMIDKLPKPARATWMRENGRQP